jgi:hypothetical protein
MRYSKKQWSTYLVTSQVNDSPINASCDAILSFGRVEKKKREAQYGG